MSSIDNNFVLARSKEHKFILETLGEMESDLRLLPSEELVSRLRNTIDEFKAKVEKHQALEEAVIFQAALEAIPARKIVSTILKLQYEHGQFNATVEALIFQLNFCQLDDTLRGRISRILNHLILSIKKHSLVEVKELFPQVSGNARCRQLIEQLSSAIEP